MLDPGDEKRIKILHMDTEKNLIQNESSNKKCQAARGFALPGNRCYILRSQFPVPFSQPPTECNATTGSENHNNQSYKFSFLAPADLQNVAKRRISH